MRLCPGILATGLLAGCNLDLKAVYGLNPGSESDTTGASQTTETTSPGDTTTVTTGPTNGTTTDVATLGTTAASTTSVETTTLGTTGPDDTTGEPADCSMLGSLLPGPPAGTRSFITDLALFPNNDFAISGAYAGDIKLGDLPASDAEGPLRAFVARVRCDGQVVWARTPEPCGDADEVPLAVAVTGDGSGVAIAGKGGAGRPFIAWHDGSGAAVATASSCFQDTGVAYDLAPIGQDDIALARSLLDQGQLLRFTKDGVQKTVDTSSFVPVALTAAGYVYVVLQAEYFIRMDRYTKNLDQVVMTNPYLGFAVSPVQISPVNGDRPSIAINVDPQIGRIALGVRGGSDPIDIQLNQNPQADIVKGCIDDSLLIVVDTIPMPSLVAWRCVTEPFNLRTLLLRSEDRLAFGGLVPGMQPTPPTPAWALSELTDPPEEIVITPAAVPNPTADETRGELAHMLAVDGKWIVVGGFAGKSMNLLGADFQAEGDLNLFLGRVEPQ